MLCPDGPAAHRLGEKGERSMSSASKVIAVATAEIGYKEKATNADLDSPAANAGGANWTKYARDLAAAGYYNGNKNGYEWCDVFVDWCFLKACGSKAEAQRVQCQTGPLGAAVNYSADYYKVQGRYDKTPRPGDQVFYQEGGKLVHTGIVTNVTAEQITTVEGNTSNEVRRRTHSRTDSYIAGYGHPRYEDGADVPAIAPAEKLGRAVTVTLNLLKVGSTGPQVKTVQRPGFRRTCSPQSPPSGTAWWEQGPGRASSGSCGKCKSPRRVTGGARPFEEYQ